MKRINGLILSLAPALGLAVLLLLAGSGQPRAAAAVSKSAASTLTSASPLPFNLQSTTHYVSLDGLCGGLAPCYTSVQAAVDAAAAGDEIRIAGGVYAGVNSYGGLAQAVYLTKTLTLRGGYSPDFGAWDPDAYPTTLDAGGQGRVLYISGAVSPTVESLRLTGGNANGLGGDPFGDAGGGVYIHSAAATLSHNVIFNNQAVASGFFDDGLGGGLYAAESAPILRGNLILSNQTGGGPYGSGQGGGLYYADSQPVLEANQIRENQAQGDYSVGGGVVLGACQGFTLTNNIIADNEATYSGSEVYLQHISGIPSRGQFIHNTIARNQSLADIEGVRVTGSGTVVTFTNTIIAGHDTGINVSFGATATLTATLWHNDTDWGDVGGIFTGTLNLWGDPEFLSPGSGDYHIAVSSPARNQGVDAGVSTDIDGEPRDANPDLGADEAGAQSLQVVKGASTSQLYPGDSLTYTIAVHSAGTLSVTHVILTDTFPALQRPLTVAFDWGNCAIPDPGYGGLVTCTLGNLEAGQSAHITLTTQVTSTLPPDPPHTMRNNVLAVGDQAQASAYVDTVLDAPVDCLARVNGALPDYPTVQEAVDAASAGDEVWIAGTCRGAFERDGLYQQAYLAKDLTLRGGYNLDFGAWDPTAYPTTLDAEGQGRVLYATGSVAVSLEHLRLTRGDATGLGGQPGGFGDAGGGLYAITATVSLSGCQVADNVASKTPFGDGFGGGAAVYTATLNATDSTFTANTGTTDNWGLGYGGALYAAGSTVRLVRSRLEGNTAATGLAGFGGGTYFYESDLGASATLWLSNTVSANLDWGQGGGLYVEGTRPFTLTNCVIADNRAYDGSGESGGGLWIDGAPGVLQQPTIARNRCDEGVHVGISTTVAITNGIVASHTVGIRAMEGSTVTVDGVLWHANVSDTVAVTATIQVSNAHSGDPAFATGGADAAHPYHLTGRSAALDRGVASGVPADVDGQPRPSGTAYDLGADEFICAAGVALDGPDSGYAGWTYDFAALAGPPAATLPITFTWQATDFSPAVRPGGLTDTISYLWPATGTKTITVTAQNCPVPVSDTQTIEIVECVTLAGVSLEGPPTTTLGLPAAFVAMVAPANAIQPITYTWQATGQPAQVHPGGGFSDTLVLTWAVTGPQTVTVTALNECGVAVSEAHRLTVTNIPPVADAGPDQNVLAGGIVTLDGSGSHDPDGHYPLAYRWAQSGGLPVALDDPHVVSPTFTAPDTPALLTFTLAVTDAHGLAAPAPDEVVVAVACMAPAGVTLSGPPTATVGSASLFIATARPLTTTLPLTYTWQATGQPLLMHISGLSDTAVLTWSVAGPQAVTVTVEGRCGGEIRGTHSLTVEAGEWFVYLPLVVKGQAP